MTRTGMDEARQRAAAVQGALRMLAHVERPSCRVRFAQDGSSSVIGPWLHGRAAKLCGAPANHWPRCSKVDAE